MARRQRVRLAFLLVATAGSVSCSSISTAESALSPTTLKCQVTLAAPTGLRADGGTGSISVTASPECAWNVAVPAGWISDPSPASGQGSGTVDFRAATNPLASSREGEIVVNDIPVRVVQEGAACRIAIAPDDQVVSAGLSDAQVTVSANGCSWTALSQDSWITITSQADGSSDGVVTFRIASNSGRMRTGTITVAGLTHTVTQREASTVPSPPGPTPPPPPPPQPPTPQPPPVSQPQPTPTDPASKPPKNSKPPKPPKK